MERPGEDTLVKYFMGDCNDAEQEVVEIYLSMGIDPDYVTACIREAALKTDLQDNKIAGQANSYPANDQQQSAWDKFQFLKSSFTNSAQPIHKKMWPWKGAVAAAALLICLSIGVLSIKSYHTKEYRVAKVPQKVLQDHAPGGNKAVLVLSNGRKINLNDAQRGTLAMEGETQILKTAEGELIYDDQLDPQQSNIAVALNTLIVPRGGQYELNLPDGSKVWLNAASSIQFPARFTGSKREVTLQGEAYFEIAKNAKMPFTVKLDKMQVEVLGTHFNIMAYADEPVVKTTLLEGAVKLSSRNGQQLLKPGQEGILSGTNKFVVKTANIEQVMAWKNGQFIFNDEDLASISRKLSRWYDINITDLRKDKNLTYTGAISKFKYVSEVLKMLELTGTMHYKIADKKVTVTSP